MRAILYARFSPRPNADECDSVERQLADLRAYCAREGWTVAGEFSDEALSGADHERPGLWTALDNVQRGDVLLVRNLNRLARDTLLALTVEDRVSSLGARIVSMEDGGELSNEPTAVLIREILHALAQYQRIINNARTSAAMQRKQNVEHLLMGHPACVPYGWTATEDRTLEPNTEERRAVKHIVKLRDAGVSWRRICRDLDAGKYPCRGTKWHPSTVREIYLRERRTQ